MKKNTHDLIRLWSEVQKEEKVQKESHERKAVLLNKIGKLLEEKVRLDE